jgi:hypothetical protein
MNIGGEENDIGVPHSVYLVCEIAATRKSFSSETTDNCVVQLDAKIRLDNRNRNCCPKLYG